MSTPIDHYPRIRRTLEILPGACLWFTFVLVIVLSFIKPVWAACFIICYALYWLFKSMTISAYLIYAYKRMRRDTKINWLEKCENLGKRKEKSWRDIYHLIILPTYKEELDVIESSFRALVKSNYPKDKMIVVLGIEERDKERGQANAQAIREKFENKFFMFKSYMHPDNIPGELKGKGANTTWSARQIRKEIDHLNIPYENIIVSNFDIDTCVHPEYFGCLTYTYLTNKNPLRSSYQPIPLYHNNIWASPALMRVVASSNSFWHMVEVARPERLRTFSSHSMPWQTLVDVGFWDTHVVSEDSRIFWQCFLHYNGNYRVTPIFVPVSMDTVLAKSYFRSMVNQYKQMRRWAYGVEHVPYALGNFIINYRKIPLWKKFIQGIRLFEGHYSWAVGIVIISFLGWLIFLFSDFSGFSQTVAAQTFLPTTRVILTIALIGLIIINIISTLILPKRPRRYSRFRYVGMIVQWILQPVAGIFFGAVPAIDAQTRFMLGKYMGFWVTEKARKY